MKRDFNIRFDDVELIGGAENFLEDSKITQFILRGNNTLLSLNSMFKGCSNLHTVDGSFNLKDIPSIASLFEGCSSLIDMPVLICNGSLNMDNAFKNCTLLPTLKFENTTDLFLESAISSFEGCTYLDGLEFYGTTSKDSMNMLIRLLNPEG